MENFFNYKRKLIQKEPENKKGKEPENQDFEENEITEILPELYSKSVITAFCILFSTIFGGVILMSNLRKKEEHKGRWQVLIFSILYTVGMIYTVYSTGTSNFTLPLNILGAIILNEYYSL